MAVSPFITVPREATTSTSLKQLENSSEDHVTLEDSPIFKKKITREEPLGYL